MNYPAASGGESDPSRIEILGVAFFALAGGIEAERKGMDLVGIYVIAFVTALGLGFFTATGTAVSMTACIVTRFALRLLAVRYDLKLPLR